MNLYKNYFVVYTNVYPHIMDIPMVVVQLRWINFQNNKQSTGQ